MIKKILKYYLPLLSVSLFISIWIFFNERKNISRLALKDLSSKSMLIVETLNPVIANIYYWSHYDFSNEDFIAESNQSFKDELGNFIVGMNHYSQFRLINTSGQEVLRLVRDDNGKILKNRTLQDKQRRGYFKKTIVLDSTQIYLSPLNLNIEFEKIEKPYKPMIRGSAPVYSKEGEKLGIVVINFYAKELLAILNKDTDANFYIIDREGNYLSDATQSAKEFQHITDPKKNINFAQENPKTWLKIKKSEDSIINDSKGFWVIDKLDIRKKVSKSSLIDGNYAKIETENEWFLISRISNYYVFASAFNSYLALGIINLLILLIITYVSKRETHNEIVRKRYMVDLNDQKNRLENQNILLSATKKRLQLRNRQLKEYNSIVAHNLRAPITCMSSLTSMLSASTNFEEVKTYIPKLNNITESINTLVQDLLIYVRVLNNNKVKLESFELEPIITDSKNLFLDILDDKVKVEVDLKAWNTINFSKIYLKSIMQNLISNAIKYRDPDKESYIVIKTDFKKDKKVLLFKDNGLGINLERHENDIFKLYKRFHKNISGKGMGLFLVKTQLESLNAQIDLESQPGIGTTFKIIFNKKPHFNDIFSDR